MPARSTTQPPGPLTSRIGGSAEGYRDIARFHHERITSLLPADWSWEGKRVLDFGCGPGRTLSEFATEAQEADFHGCDIHAESIAWAKANHPEFTFFVNREEPPLDLPGGCFDLVYGVSVFTHLTEHWSGWLAEMHRILKPGGLAIFSFLGEAMWNAIRPAGGEAWNDDATGMLVTELGNPWETGGPNVFHSEWWLREHWGRGFEVAELRPRDSWRGVEGHAWVVLRRGEGRLSAQDLARLDPQEQREAPALARNLRLLMREVPARSEKSHERIAQLEAELERQRPEVARLRSRPARAALRGERSLRRALGKGRGLVARLRRAGDG